MVDRFQIVAHKVGGLPMLNLIGDLDAYTVEKLRTVATLLIENGANEIILNCADMSSLDSSGIGAFIAINKTLIEAKGKLLVCCVRPAIMKVLQLTKVDILIKVFNSPEEVAAFMTADKAKASGNSPGPGKC